MNIPEGSVPRQVLNILTTGVIQVSKILTVGAIPHPPPYGVNKGGEYAKKLAKKTQGLSLLLTILGWLLVVLGAMLAVIGPILGPGLVLEPSNPESRGILMTIEANRGVVCSAFGIILGGLGWQLLDRAAAATRTASVATRAIMTATLPDTNNGNLEESDRRAYEACVQAKSSWLEGRMSNDQLDKILNGLGPPPG